MRELDGLRTELYAVHLYRILWELDTLTPFLYYELLTECIHTISYTEVYI